MDDFLSPSIVKSSFPLLNCILMAITYLSPASFEQLLGQYPLVDLRRARAFRAYALPGAVHLPRQSYRDAATLALKLAQQWPGQNCLLYDQSGEMKAVLDLLPQAYVLAGGAQAWRAWQQEIFAAGPSLILLGGLTGVGKTEALEALSEQGAQVINLERLARHSGSTFGNLWNQNQLPNGEFQYELLKKWREFDSKSPVWIEEEGAYLGQNSLPPSLHQRMQNSPMILLDRPMEKRLDRIVEQYGNAPAAGILKGIEKLGARMGIANSQRARHYFEAGRVRESFRILLAYYDTTYQHRRDQYHQGPIIPFEVPATNFIQELIALGKEMQQ